MGKENNPHGLKVGQEVYVRWSWEKATTERIASIGRKYAKLELCWCETPYRVDMSDLFVDHDRGGSVGKGYLCEQDFLDERDSERLYGEVQNFLNQYPRRKLSLSQLREAAKALGIESKGTQ